MVQSSGGEPSIHSQIIPMLRASKERGIAHVMLNTNGKRIAHDDHFLQQLAELRPSIYFQFDGFDTETYGAIHGNPDILPEELRSLDRLAMIDCDVVLVPAIEQGVNQLEAGRMVRFALEHPAVRGINFRPAWNAGRHGPHDPLQRQTIPAVLGFIEEQTDGLFTVVDFVPVPCCFPTRNSVTYAYVGEGGVTVLPRILNVDDYLDYITNRDLPDLGQELKTAAQSAWLGPAALPEWSGRWSVRLACAVTGYTAW